MSLHISKTRLFAGLFMLGGLMATAAAEAQQARPRSDCEVQCTQALFKESCINMCGDPSQTAAAKKKKRPIRVVKILSPEVPVAKVFSFPETFHGGEGGGGGGGGGGGRGK